MPTTVPVYQAFGPQQPLVPGTIERRDLRQGDVSIDIDYCGYCSSDTHQRDGDWGPVPYPIVPGHEIVGHVRESNDSRFTPGQLVGVGCMVQSGCTAQGHTKCNSCAADDEVHCTDGGCTLTYNSKDKIDGTTTYGGYSKNIVVHGDFVLRIPSNLDPAAAAPLLCAGITVYSPLARFGAGPGKKVLVSGLGGLGHMGVKLAKAFGAEVWVSSRSMAKAQAAKELGADHMLITSDQEQFAAFQGQFDLVIDTIGVDHDFNQYLTLLKPYGAMALVGHIGTTTLHTAPLVMGNKILAGSCIGGQRETQEMLDFCGKHSITATIELVSYKDINAVWERLSRSDVKYRFVFDNKTLE